MEGRRRAMVALVRSGRSMRAVARHFGVRLRTVQVWLARAHGRRLDRVDWRTRLRGRRRPVNRMPRRLEQRVLAVRTIGRILARHGALDHWGRLRRPPPPPGWHLPAVAAHASELDLFDVIEDLKLAGGPLVDVLTSVSLHGGLPGAWPLVPASTSRILPYLLDHWQAVGLPGYAQFDDDTRCQGAHQHPDIFGRVTRLCLQLGITPVFVPPHEFGLQNAIETFNGLYQAKLWRRFHFTAVRGLATHSLRYIGARRQRLAERLASAPWQWEPRRLPASCVIFIRRTSEDGAVTRLGHTGRLDRHWPHRLVRAAVDLAAGAIRRFALRRRAPHEQPVWRVIAYTYPRDDLGGDSFVLALVKQRPTK